LTGANGAQVDLSSLGATITAFRVPTASGGLTDITLGFDSPGEYLSPSNPYYGASVGRVANRIDNGKFSIDGKEYSVTIRKVPGVAKPPVFSLHGGQEGFSHKAWQSEVDGDSVVFSYFSRDGEEGYPGNLIATTRYYVIATSWRIMEKT